MQKNDIRDVGSTADLVLVFFVHLVHWYLVHWYPLVPTGFLGFLGFLGLDDLDDLDDLDVLDVCS